MTKPKQRATMTLTLHLMPGAARICCMCGDAIGMDRQWHRLNAWATDARRYEQPRPDEAPCNPHPPAFLTPAGIQIWERMK